MIRIVIALAVIVVLAVGALVVFLPGMVNSPAVRERIQAAARENLGREVRYDELSFGFFPPRLVVNRAEVSGKTPDDPPWAEVEAVALQLQLLPLLTRTLVIDSLVVEGATLRLVRSADGIETPQPEPKEDAAKPAPSEDEAGGGGVTLAVSEVRLSRTRILLEDRTVSPRTTWDLREIEATGRADSLDDPIELSLATQLGSGGSLRVEGNARIENSVLDLVAKLDRVAVKPAAPYLGQKLEGSLSGTVKARGPAAALEKVEAQLTLTDGVVDIDEIGLRGRIDVDANLSGGKAWSGTFDVDATQAELAYGEAFAKPAGTPATVSGRIEPEADGTLGVDDVKLKIKNFEAEARVRSGKRLQVQATARPFDLAGWDELLPALEGYDLSGKLAPGELAIATQPFDLRGRIVIDGVRAQVPEAGKLVVRGALEGLGNRVRVTDTVVETAGQELRVEAEATNLDATPRYGVRLRADGADTNTLLSTFTSVKDTVFGKLVLDANLDGSLGERPLQALRGTTRLEISPGRLKGVSLLRNTMGRLAVFGEAALLISALKGSRSMERFYGDEFQTLSGTWKISGGAARTDDLQLVYRHYRADLRGSVGLEDLRLDLRGELTIDEEVDQELAKASATGTSSKKRVIPLAHVTGTLDSPRVDLSPQAVSTLVAGYAAGRARGQYQDELDERLGKELGGQVGDALEGLLGGKR